ncbi:hypothetical protein K470DRAFT_209999 [Piedraia hortae CBS 480.64]|uniref:Mitochondrial adapter protein MCP1 transmembrane domain-containing protein n=1 Tax=Piedraia hortae CBS 480.64 TaxID=1314780 RepID=A0A6A7C8Q2_9PEZI|nr:hypothetical protein K470DRAFT_209999 [Piedraia hortae CBS 480.64]
MTDLTRLDPSPVESPSSADGAAYFPPAPRTGLSQHSAAWYLQRIQRYSSYSFTAFAAAHLVNTAIIPLVRRSVAASEHSLLLTRPYYQGFPFEPLLVGLPLAAHVFSGIALRVTRRQLNAKRYGDDDGVAHARFWPRLSGTSILGYALVPLLAAHVYMNRAIPQSFPGGASNINLSYVSHAFASHPITSTAGFVALIGVGAAHIVGGWARWLGYAPMAGRMDALRVKKRRYTVSAITAVLAGLWMAGGIGIVGRGGRAPGYVGKLYDQMLACVPFVGRML